MIDMFVPEIRAPFHFFNICWCEMALLKASAIIINKVGDKGSPCRIPYVEGKNPSCFPLMINENQAPEIQALTHLH